MLLLGVDRRLERLLHRGILDAVGDGLHVGDYRQVLDLRLREVVPNCLIELMPGLQSTPTPT